MKDIRVDADGEFRCWNCGHKGLIAKRTLRSKMLVGVGALLTKKKLKCQTCGEYNDTGNAKPYEGPASRKWRKHWDKLESAKSAEQRQDETARAKSHADAFAVERLGAEAGGGEGQGSAPMSGPNLGSTADSPASIPPPPPPPPPPGVEARPPDWAPDPTARHELRYWDGVQWTAHVSDNGVQATDEVGVPEA